MKTCPWKRLRFLDNCYYRILFGFVALTHIPLSGFAADNSSPVGLDTFMTQRGYKPVKVWVGTQNHLLTMAKINGRTVRCELVTPESDIIIDPRFAAGLRSTGEVTSPKYSHLGKIGDKFSGVSIDQFEIGGLAFSNLNAIVYDLHKFYRVATGTTVASSDTGETREALLGAPFFKATHAWLDCTAPRLYVRDQPLSDEMSDIVTKSFAMSNIRPITMIDAGSTSILTNALINGHPASFFLAIGEFDTMVDRSALAPFSISGANTDIGKARDLKGKKAYFAYTRLSSLKVGDVELKKFPVVVEEIKGFSNLEGGMERLGAPPLAGYLGPDVLARCASIIDWQHGQMFLLTHSSPN